MDKNIINGKWQGLQKDGGGETEPIDLIQTNPPNKPGPVPNRSKENYSVLRNCKLQTYVKHSERMLVTGGYVVVFMNAFAWIDWFTELTKTSFHVMPYPASFTCQIETDWDPDVFPRNNGDMAVIARQVGDHPRGFNPAFCDSTGFDNAPKSNAYFCGVPSSENRLLQDILKSPFSVTEKSTSLLQTIISPYRPLCGTILDSFAGTCTTAISEMQCGRREIAIEEDS